MKTVRYFKSKYIYIGKGFHDIYKNIDHAWWRYTLKGWLLCSMIPEAIEITESEAAECNEKLEENTFLYKL